MAYSNLNLAKEQLHFAINQNLYETSDAYRCRVDYVIKLIGEQAQKDLVASKPNQHVIYEEADFVLGYN
ncbi:hypothetical protein [Shewanella waksmanii]|uniref:hypothetical protein n=1 Tax=Shewanella waksmanii TaxID=213783 RepID=UPI0037362E20